MLKLARKPGQWLRLVTESGETIWVRPELKGTRIYLAVCAPDSVKILRDEALPEEERFERTPEGIYEGPRQRVPLAQRLRAVQEGRSQ
jgi:sRNA-binding carbon storage regulator CsrA